MTVAGGLLGAVLVAAVAGTPVFAFDDPEISESSGLVDLGALMVTTNDSGGGPLVYVVDKAGRTVGRTTYTDEVVDVEALAPAGPDEVWVGDIGDNREARSRVQVYRVPVGRGDRTVAAPSYDLVYPDGPHDAESLLYGPDGRLRIVTKGIIGGQVYVAPKKLDPDRPNRLRAGPDVSLWATDAALFPDGKHVIVRGYGSAMVARFPSFEPLGMFGLPNQEQGEGISVGSSGRIRVSSEGVHSRVLQVRLPAEIRAKLADRPESSPGQDATPATGHDDAVSLTERWALPVVGGVLLGGAILTGVLGWLIRRRH
ncbi:hypothetical protein EFK50_00630 [Nocardioides marmoriginsengisoli]|uniref:WD40 repeat domain-containing protein n=1 Tax=Nocardioides marmoriginsengisoli TaxID=661483 RepID=A0A3N0CRT2_9ACTN|nr:hypothetical protein [Nocardioides marmoriginsengisoli]RNL66168.1 hypothetical protein EFK50_00630 [Nocardioides marmoriginsengisoli]